MFFIKLHDINLEYRVLYARLKKLKSISLQIAELSHSVSSPMSFRVEYKRGSTAPAMFQRQVRFRVDVSTITKQTGESPQEYLYAITFTLLSGNIHNVPTVLCVRFIFVNLFPVLWFMS